MMVLETPTTNGPGGPNFPPVDQNVFGGNEGSGEPEEFYRTQSLLHRMSELAIRMFSFRPLEAPERMSEHFGRAEKRNVLTPYIKDPVANTLLF